MYSTLHDASTAETDRIAEAVRQCETADELRALYKDLQSPRSPLRDPNSKLQVGRINYTVWSEVFSCPACSGEIVFLNEALDSSTQRVLDDFQCPHCRASVTKSQITLIYETAFDLAIGQSARKPKRVAVLVNYGCGKVRFEKKTDSCDIELLSRIQSLQMPAGIPTVRMPEMHMMRVGRMRTVALTHLHQFFLPRPVYPLVALWAKAQNVENPRLRRFMLFAVEQTIWGLSLLARYTPTHFSQVNQYLNGVYYIASMISEVSPWYILDGKVKRLTQAFVALRTDAAASIVMTGSCDVNRVPDNSVDYLFTDPPFGENIYYADLNFLIESWHRVTSQPMAEAIIDQEKKKRLVDYQARMTACFAQYFCALKPGRWMTVEFHNSANAVWNAIQEGLERAGFVVADVRTLDKKQGSFQQTTSAGAVKKDLVISCYKPHHSFEERFRHIQGQPEGVIEFLREHLAMLPVAPVNKAGRLEAIAERTRFLLFDRMVAYHLQHGARIPLSAADFYKLLEEQFIERDEMYFLNEQSARYDALKARGVETEQLSIFVRDEKTAVQWVRSRLAERPQTSGDLTPQFMQELREWESHEPRPELRDLLKEYFVEENGVWRVPDPDSEKDIENMRRNALLRLFREYTNAKGPIKVFRKEAVLEGFRHCWQTQQYGVIVAVCEKIPEKILQEIQDFVMMYDVAKDLAGSQEADQQTFHWE